MAKVRKRRISHRVREKQHKKKWFSKEILIVIIIAGVMILSIFGIMFSNYNDQQQQNKYGDFKFVGTSSGWMTEVNGKQYSFNYLPSQLDSLNISDETKQLLQSSAFILTFDPTSKSISQIEAFRLTFSQQLYALNKIAMPGITKPSNQYNLSIITCSNSTKDFPVIYMKEAVSIINGSKIREDTKITSKENCIILVADETEWLAVQDRLKYLLLGIIK